MYVFTVSTANSWTELLVRAISMHHYLRWTTETVSVYILHISTTHWSLAFWYAEKVHAVLPPVKNIWWGWLDSDNWRTSKNKHQSLWMTLDQHISASFFISCRKLTSVIIHTYLHCEINMPFGHLWSIYQRLLQVIAGQATMVWVNVPRWPLRTCIWHSWLNYWTL